MKILSIETSCDETAAAVVEVKSKKLIANSSILSTSVLNNVIASQVEIHKKFGGVFPEHASRAHTEKIIPVVRESLGNIQPDVLAVTIGPGLIGSLLVGVNFAKTYAFSKNLPIIGINHWLGHIYSNWAEGSQASEMPVSSVLRFGRDQATRPKRKPMSRLARVAESELMTRGLPQFPALILIASGGHTGLVLMKSHSKIQALGETLDDAAGEAFDKVAALLELPYPGGPSISKIVQEAKFKMQNAKVKMKTENLKLKIGKLPRSMLDRKDFNFSFSGLKTAVLDKFKELTKRYTLYAIRSPLAAEFQQAVIDILIGKTIQVAYKFRPKSICLCGGVSANKELREQMKKAVSGLPWHSSFHIPHLSLTTDNAAMIGIAAAYREPKEFTTYDKINTGANLKL